MGLYLLVITTWCRLPLPAIDNGLDFFCFFCETDCNGPFSLCWLIFLVGELNTTLKTFYTSHSLLTDYRRYTLLRLGWVIDYRPSSIWILSSELSILCLIERLDPLCMGNVLITHGLQVQKQQATFIVLVYRVK